MCEKLSREKSNKKTNDPGEDGRNIITDIIERKKDQKDDDWKARLLKDYPDAKEEEIGPGEEDGILYYNQFKKSE